MAETPATPNNTLTYTDGLPASLGRADRRVGNGCNRN